MRLDNWLSQRAATGPDRFAVGDHETSLDYAAYERQAVKVARQLASRGARRGSVVAIDLPAGTGYAVVLQALMKLGAIAQPLNPRLPAAQREEVLEASRPTCRCLANTTSTTRSA